MKTSRTIKSLHPSFPSLFHRFFGGNLVESKIFGHSVIRAILITICLTGCLALAGCRGKGPGNASSEKPYDTVVSEPEQQYLTDEQLQESIDKEIRLAIDVGNEYLIEEATRVIEMAKNTYTFLLNGDYSGAKQHLARAIARAELITRGNPADAVVPAAVDIDVIELVNSVEEAIELKKRLDSLMAVGDVQEARRLIPRMANEIIITRESVPVPTYLRALEKVEVLVAKEEYEKAIIELNTVLSQSVIESRTIPIPLIRAQRMIVEADDLSRESREQSEDIQTLLGNAEYQINFSDILGYGFGEEDYGSLYEDIRLLKNLLANDETGEFREKLDEMKEDLDRLTVSVSQYR